MLAILAALVLNAAPYPTEDQRITLPQDKAACETQWQLPWCAGSDAAPKALSVEDVTAIQAQAFAHFAPDSLSDPLVWTTHRNDVLAGRSWSGQCNDMVLTTLDMLARAGLRRADMWRVIVILGPGSKPDHQIGVVRVDGQFWVVGDIATPSHAPYPLSQAHYWAVFVNHASDGRIWRRVDHRGGGSVRQPPQDTPKP